MPINERVGINNAAGLSVAGIGSVAVLLVLSAVALTGGAGKVLVISWVAFVAMGAGAWLGARGAETNPFSLVWGYGLASGAMVTSAAMFLVPQAMGLGSAAGTPRLGGIGIAAGIVAGYGTHTVGHRLTHVDTSFDTTAAAISAHALSAGLIIGLVYASMPTLGLLLGLAIVSHKGPAGYAAARRLVRNGNSPSALLLPAAGVGLTAIPVAYLSLSGSAVTNAVVFGFAAGVFLHIAMDFLPSCEIGGEIDQVADLSPDSHALLDRMRVHALFSTTVGGLAVLVAWLVLSQ